MINQDPRIKEAENKRKKRNFIMKFLFNNDYIGSGDLFVDVGNSTNDLVEKEKYFKEAAKTYGISKTKFGYFKSAEVYKILLDLEMQNENQNIDKLKEYSILYAENMIQSGNNLLAAVGFTKAGDIYEKISLKLAIENYKKAEQILINRKEYKNHLKSIKEKLLNFYIDTKNYEESLNIIKDLNLTYKRLSIELLMILLGKESEEEGPINIKEKDIIRCVLNKSGEEGIAVLESFLKDNYLPVYVKKIFLAVIDKINPENSIC